VAAFLLPGDRQQINTNQSLPRCPRLVSHLPPGREGSGARDAAQVQRCGEQSERGMIGI